MVRRHALALSISVYLVTASVATGATDLQRTAGPAGGPWRRLFLETKTVIESQQGLQRVFHPMRKHKANPLIRKTGDWEGRGPYLYGSVLREGPRWRMWYHHWGPDAPYFNSYAESRDGLHWTKPNLGTCEWKGSRQNNLVFGRSTEGLREPYKSFGVAHNMSVMFNPFSKDPAKRYICFFFSYPYLRPRWAYSADGLRFTPDPASRQVALFPTNDVMNVTFDPYKRRYVATRKQGNAKGRAAGIAWSYDGLKWEMPTFTDTYVRHDGQRVVRTTVVGGDQHDPPAMQVYGMPVFAYQGLYIGLPWMYAAGYPMVGGKRTLSEAEQGTPRTIHVELAWSTDLVRWRRPVKRTPLIPLGGPGAFDAGMITTQNTPPLVVGDELWLYYGGCTRRHHEVGTGQWAIGLATLRLDGFVSMRAGEREGWLVTRPEDLPRPAVCINARVQAGGYVVAELLDRAGRALPGFARTDACAFTGDAVRHMLTWKHKEFGTGQARDRKRIRFYLKKADLFSYAPGSDRSLSYTSRIGAAPASVVPTGLVDCGGDRDPAVNCRATVRSPYGTLGAGW